MLSSKPMQLYICSQCLVTARKFFFYIDVDIYYIYIFYSFVEGGIIFVDILFVGITGTSQMLIKILYKDL